MKLLYCALYHDYGCVERGKGFEEINLGNSLRHMKDIEVVDFHFDVLWREPLDLNVELHSTIRNEKAESFRLNRYASTGC